MNTDDFARSVPVVCYLKDIVSMPSEPTVPPRLGSLHGRESSTQLEKQLESGKKELAYARLKIQVLEEKLRQQRIAQYGPGSEKLSDLQLELLDEAGGEQG